MVLNIFRCLYIFQNENTIVQYSYLAFISLMKYNILILGVIMSLILKSVLEMNEICMVRER